MNLNVLGFVQPVSLPVRDLLGLEAEKWLWRWEKRRKGVVKAVLFWPFGDQFLSPEPNGALCTPLGATCRFGFQVTSCLDLTRLPNPKVGRRVAMIENLEVVF